MWAYYVTERVKDRTPTGAELDRLAGTNNYGRRVLSRWSGHIMVAYGSGSGSKVNVSQVAPMRHSGDQAATFR